MTASEAAAPDGTAVRVALWRALHAHIDAPPRIFADDLGLRLVAPADDWRHRPDMDPDFTRPSRVSIVVRSRFIEDLVLQESARGVAQYTPFVGYFTPEAMLALAREAGLSSPRHLAADELGASYLAGRAAGLRLARGEEFLLAAT